MKENSWQQISEQLDMTVKDCQRIWLNLRNKYGREKKSLPSGSGASVTPQWEYFESMSFLNAYVKPRNTHTATPVVAKKPTATTVPPPIFIDTSSSYSAWLNSDLGDINPLDSSTQSDILMSPRSNTENGGHLKDDDMYEEIQRPEEQARTANFETVQLANKGKSKNKRTLSEPDTSKEALDAAKSIMEHLKILTQNQQPKTSADILCEYVASVLNEMTHEKQKIKRRKILDILEDDD